MGRPVPEQISGGVFEMITYNNNGSTNGKYLDKFVSVATVNIPRLLKNIGMEASKEVAQEIDRKTHE